MNKTQTFGVRFAASLLLTAFCYTNALPDTGWTRILSKAAAHKRIHCANTSPEKPRPGQAPIYIPIGDDFSPSSLSGGSSTVLTVTLSATAATAQTVAVSTDQPLVFANLPASIVVPAGSQSASITVQTVGVTSTVTANVTVTTASGSLSSPLTVTP